MHLIYVIVAIFFVAGETGGLVDAAAESTRTNIDGAPELDDSDSVEFYVMTSSFPYNAPDSIREMAGDNFREYGISHGGLGVWDKTTDYKFTIEFVSEDYVGALLPDFDQDSGSLVWSNQGEIVFTLPAKESDWQNSQLICDTTGVAYNQLVTYLQDNEDSFTAYQPVQVQYHHNTTSTSHRAQVEKRDSFWFVSQLVAQLSSYGADTEAFLEIHATSYEYIARTPLLPEVVQWAPDGAATPDVFAWYQRLTACYHAVYNQTVDNGKGAEYFLEAVKSCYEDYAYVYLSDTSVYNVSLGNVSSTYSTPNLQRYVFALPDDGDDSKARLQPIDIVVIVAVVLMVVAGVFVLLKTICSKKRRRRISVAGDEVAVRTVDRIAGDHLEDGHALKAYYRPPPTLFQRLTGLVSRPAGGKGRGGGGAAGESGGGIPGVSSFSGLSAVGVGSVVGAQRTLGLASDRALQPNSNDSDPSSDLVLPLAGRQSAQTDYGADMQYLDRVAATGVGYVSPVLPESGASSVSATRSAGDVRI